MLGQEEYYYRPAHDGRTMDTLTELGQAADTMSSVKSLSLVCVLVLIGLLCFKK